MRKIKNYLLAFVALFSYSTIQCFDVMSECSISSPSVASGNPGTSPSIYVTFYAQGQNKRKVEIINQTGNMTLDFIECSMSDLIETNGNVLNPSPYPSPLEVTGLNDFVVGAGNHTFIVTGNIPNNAQCGQTATFTVRIKKKDGFVWWNECDQTFTINVNQAGVLYVNGPSTTCNLQPQNYLLTGVTASSYTWNSTNTSFKLNGSSNWPITTTTNNVSIAPTVSGSSSTISVSATSPSFCGTASSSINIQSINTAVTLSGNPSTCNETGGGISVQATNIPGATYNWWRKPMGTSNWGSAIGSMGNSLSLAGQNQPSTYNIRCQATVSGCKGTFSYIDVNWCTPNPPGQVSCCYNPGKREIGLSPEAEDFDLKLTPNPASKFVTINTSKQFNLIAVYDVTGKKVKSINYDYNNEVILNVENLKAGIYTVEVFGEGFTQHAKIILTK